MMRHVLHWHSAWSESSAARPRPRGGHRTGEKLELGHLRRSKGEACRAEPTSPFFVVSDQKRQILDPLSHQRVFPREPIRHAVVDCLSPDYSVTANPITTLSCAYTVRKCYKVIKMTDFSKTGSRNMAKTCAINFRPRFPIRLLQCIHDETCVTLTMR